MRKHVDLLGILFIIAGLLNALIGVALLSLAVGAAALFSSGAPEGRGFAAGLAAALFAAVSLVLLAWGAGHVWAGAGLRRLRAWARPAALAMALLNLFVPPLGTALGIYGLWVLLNEQARQLFDPIPA